MKKFLFLIFIALFFSVSTNAQYVDIPDANFKSAIKNRNNLDACFDNNGMLDTTCAGVLNAIYLDVALSNISNLEGIQYFKSLKYLYCSNNLLMNLPTLPQSLILLDCSTNQLNSLPSLGDSLQDLECYRNNIYCLPKLPGTLKTISLDSTKIHCIPNVTAATIYYDIVNIDNYAIKLPICNSTNNTSSCPSVPFTISGRVFYDIDSNGVQDSASEPYLENIKITLTGNSKTYSAVTNKKGFYLFFPEVAGDYTLTVDTLSKPYTVTPVSSIFNINGDTSITQDIAVQLPFNNKDNLMNKDNLTIIGKGHFTGCACDLGDNNFVTRFDGGNINITYGNNGTISINPIIVIDYDANSLTYNPYSITSNGWVLNTGKSLILIDSNLLPGENRNLIVSFNGGTNAVINRSNLPETAYIIAGDSNGLSTLISNDYAILLPLKLTAFKAYEKSDNKALLTWATTDEINTKSFYIERSEDGIKFSAIAALDAKGKSRNLYNYTVENLTATTTYFRLKIIDKDGKYAYSAVVKVINNNAAAITISPNPANKKITIQNRGNALINTTAKIINDQGAVVKNILLKQSTENVDISDLPSGVYIVQTQIGAKRIIIIH